MSLPRNINYKRQFLGTVGYLMSVQNVLEKPIISWI